MRRQTRMRFLRVFLTVALLAPSAMVCQSSRFQGSVPAGAASSTPVALTLHDAIDRGLKANLGLLTSDSQNEISRGQRIQALSALLPQFNAEVREVEQQNNLKTLGFNFSFPGVSIPTIVGPFHYTDVRASASWTAFDYSLRKNYLSAQENKRAAQLSVQDARDLVVQSVASAYLQIIAGASRVDA